MYRREEVPPGLMVLHHCDNPLCVRGSHLYAGTAQDNSDDAVRRGRIHTLHGDAHPNSKLSNDEAQCIRTLVGVPQIEMAHHFGVSKQLVSKIVNHKIRRRTHMTTLPKALLKELPEYSDERKKYNAKELVLALLANNTEGVTTKDMMIYVWEINKTIVKRTYLYQMLYRLRSLGLIHKAEFRLVDNGPDVKTYCITEEGRQMARPYIEVNK
jgi:predicted transcriptional regulator